MNDGADDSPTANSLAVAAATAVAVELTVDHPSILRPDAARAPSAASAALLHDSSSSGQLSPVDASNGHPHPDTAANPQQVALPPPGKRYRSTPAKTFQCKGFGDCRMVFSRSEHLARHIRKHTGERPFQCHCAKQFSRLDNLRQHAQTVHADKPDLNEKMMKELTTLHTSMSAASGTTKRANKRGKNPQADAVVPPNSNYGLNGAGARNGAGGPYDPPAPDPYANAPGAPGWQPPVGNANYVNHTGYHTQYVDGGQYAAFPLSEAFPSTPAYAHHPHHAHHSQSYAVQHHGYAPPSAAAAVQGYDFPPHAGAQRHSDPDSPLSNGHPPASASDLASPLTPTSAHTYSAYHPHHQHQHQHQHQHPHSHQHQHPHSHQQQHPQHLTAATAYAGHPHGMSPVPTPPPQSFRPPLHGVRDGAGGGELYSPSVHQPQYAPNGAPPTSYIPGGGDAAAGVGVGVPARAVVVPGEHAQLGVHRFGPGISIPAGVRGNGPPPAAAVTTPIDEQHPSAYALSGGGGGGHARLAQQQYYHPQQQRHHPHEQQQQFEGANGGYHPAVVARTSYHHGYEDEQHHHRHQHQHQHHLAAPAGSDGAGGGRSPIEAFPNLGQSALRTAPAVSNAAAAAAQSSRAMVEYNGVGVGNGRTSSSPPFRYTLPADSSVPPVRGSPSGGQAVYTNSTHPHSHVHRGYRLSTIHHHGVQQQHQQQQLSANGSNSANNEDPFSFHPPPLSTSAPGGGTGAGFGGNFYRSRPATAQGTGSESRPQSRRLAIMDLCDNPGEEMYDIRPRTAGGVVQRRSGPGGGGSSPPALNFAFNIVGGGGGGGLAPPGGGGFSSRPNSSAGRAAGLEQYAVVSGSSRPGTSAGGNGNGSGSGLALAPLRIDGSGLPAAAHGGGGGGGGEEDGDGDEDADGDADGDD